MSGGTLAVVVIVVALLVLYFVATGKDPRKEAGVLFGGAKLGKPATPGGPGSAQQR